MFTLNKIFLALQILGLYLISQFINPTILPFTCASPILRTQQNQENPLQSQFRLLRSLSSGRKSKKIGGTLSYNPIVRIILPQLIHETMIASEDWNGAETNLEFTSNPNIFENMTRARLNLPLRDTSLKFPLTLLASVASESSSGGWDNLIDLQMLNDKSTTNSLDNTVSFDVFEFIQNATNKFRQDQIDNILKIKVNFQIRHQCEANENELEIHNNANTNCQPILDTNNGISFLKVDFTKDNQDSSSNLEQLLNNLKQRKNIG